MKKILKIMYKYVLTDSIFDGVSNIYLISIATAFLAVIVASYCSNFLKDESEKQLEEVLNDLDEGNEGEKITEKHTKTEIGNHYQVQEKVQSGLKDNDLGSASDSEYNDYYKNTFASNGNSDVDSDSDEFQIYGLVSKLKSKKFKKLEAQLTRDQLEEERRIESEQLAAIFELLKKQEAELNMKEIDESELNAQLALYR